jgi:hypothetical protein
MIRLPRVTNGLTMKSKHTTASKPILKMDLDQQVIKVVEEIRRAYSEALMSHRKAGIYDYLALIYSRTRRLTRTGNEAERVQQLSKATARRFRSDTSLASALIQVTSRDGLHKQVRSKWVRVIEKAMRLGIDPKDFTKRVEDDGSSNRRPFCK